MKVLITGGTGFIGRRLIARLAVGTGCEVVAVVRTEPAARLGCRTRLLDGGQLEAASAIIADERPDAIVHMAAAGVDPQDREVDRLVDVNVTWIARLVQAAARAGTRCIVVVGSSAEYASPAQHVRLVEDDPLESRKLYGATKAAGGLLALASGAACDIGIAVLRLFNVYGAGEAPHRLFPSIVQTALNGRSVALSAGSQIRDFIEVDDACRAIQLSMMALLDGTLPNAHYNVCSGVGTSVANFAKAVAARLSAAPDLLRFGAIPLRADDVPWLVGDPSRLNVAIGWRALDLETGIAHAVSDSRARLAQATPTDEIRASRSAAGQ